MTRAVRVHEHGGPEVLRNEELPIGAPGPGEARIRHTAIGLNFIDVYFRSGLYPVAGLPFVPGLEAAGVVEEVGEGVEGLAPGDRVAYAARPLGAYAQARCLPADVLVPLPPGVGDELAAAAMLKGMTAEYLVRRTFPLGPGHVALVHAAAGGVGSLLCQWARHLGARVIGTAGSEEKAEQARADGCEHVILYRERDFVADLRERTEGRGADVVYDSVGAHTLRGSLDCLAPRGMLVSFGQSSGPPPPIALGELASRGSLFLTRPSLMDYTATRAELLESAGALFDLLARGLLRVRIGQRWPLAEAAQAHRALEQRRTRGATLLLPDGAGSATSY